MRPDLTRTERYNGFTLLEIVIILCIVGTMIAAFSAFYQPLQTSRANYETAAKMEKIMDAATLFALRNNRLPCPGNPREPDYPGIAPASCPPGGTWVRIGIVPYYTLGLTQDDVIDGFGRYITYAVGSGLLNSSGSSADDNETIISGDRSNFCTNQGYNASINGTLMNSVALALVAYGPDGLGAFNMQASDPNDRFDPIGAAAGLLDINMGTFERANAVDRMADWSTVQVYTYNATPGSNHFDDQVVYMTGQALVSRLGITGCH